MMNIMKRPKYMTQMCSFIFFVLGVTFILVGLFVSWGVVSPSKHSVVQDERTMALCYYLISLVSFVVSAILISIACLKEKKGRELIAEGNLLLATVERVQYRTWTRFGNVSPYVVYFSYLVKGEVHRNRTYLLWEKPNLIKGDSIDIYVNDFAESAAVL